MEVAGELNVLIVFGIAVVVTFVTSLLKNVTWTDKVKNLLATGLSIVAAAIAAWTAGDFEGQTLFELSVYIYGLAQGFYSLLLKGTVINEKLEHSLVRVEPRDASH